MNDNDPLSEFDHDNTSRSEEKYNKFAPGREKLNEPMASHRCKNGQLQFNISFHTKEHTWETFPGMKEYHPRATDDYMVCNNATRNKSRDSDLKWAKHTICDIRRMIRRTIKLYDFRLEGNDRLFCVIRKIRGSKKKQQVDFTWKKFKYVLEGTQNIKRALDIGAEQEDTNWCDYMALEVHSLINIDFFESEPAGTKPPNSEFQETKLHCVFAINHDLRRRSRLEAGGHLIDLPTDLQIYSSQVKILV